MLCKFYKGFSFRYFGLYFVGLYFVLVSDYLVKFRPWCYSLHPDIIYHCNVTYSTLINTSALLKKDFCFNSVLDIQSFFLDNHKLTVYQLKDRGITQFEFSTLISCYVNFIRDFLFVILGFILLGYILFWLAII